MVDASTPVNGSVLDQTRMEDWRREWQRTPVFLPGKFHGQRSLAGYSPWCCKESDTTERLHFPDSSDGKESACNVGELGSIPELGRSPGEGNGNLLQYSCLENSMDRGTWWETRVQSLNWEEPLEKKMATHASILAWKIPWIEEPGRLQSMGSLQVRHD